MRDFPTVELRLLHSDRVSTLKFIQRMKNSTRVKQLDPCSSVWGKYKVSLCTAKATQSKNYVVYNLRVTDFVLYRFLKKASLSHKYSKELL